MSFTHDESVSFQIASGVDTFAHAPNNHLLNTMLMKFFGIFSKSELSLRMPNVLAFVLYCIAGLGIIRNLKKPFFSVLFMAILVLNALMLEFFGLARGYGLSIGLSMAAFFCLFMLDKPDLSVKKYMAYFVLTLFFSQLALYANLSALNLHAALLAVMVLGLVPYLKTAFSGKKRNWIILLFAGILIVDLLALRPAVSRLMLLQKSNELSVFGGEEGLIKTTVSSLVTTFFYYQPYTPKIFSIVLATVISVFTIAGLWVIGKMLRKQFDNLSRTFLVLSLLLLAPVLQNILFHIPYPVDRTALLYFPLFVLLFILLIAQAHSLTGNHILQTAVIIALIGTTALTGYNSYKNFNLEYTYLWRLDTHNREMMELIASDHGASAKQDSVSVSCVWIYEPAINYYRVSRNYQWMIPANREGIKPGSDYVICLADYLNHMPNDSLMVLKKFEDVQTVLLKNKYPKKMPGIFTGK